MATLSPPSSSLHSIPFSPIPPTTPSPSLAFRTFFPFHRRNSSSNPFVSLKSQNILKNSRLMSVAKAVEEETQEQVAIESEQQEQASTSEQLPVVVPVSPSDTLTMFFQAEGTLNESAIPTLTQALEEIDGVANLKVQVVEGLASVELRKQTTVQATGVASSLLETIQGSSFKLQTLNLSFDEEEDAAA